MTIPFLTRSGAVDLADLRRADVSAEALGEALAKINRFGGRTPEPWSVAAHSVLVEALCPPEIRPWALLHDAHKAFLGDLTDPAVELLCRRGTRSAVEHAILNAEAWIDRRIAQAWATPVRSRNAGLMAADQVAFLAEAWVFLGIRPGTLDPATADLLDCAVETLRGLPQAGDWRGARSLWMAQVRHHARLGAFSPPRDDDPTGMGPVG
jgi:hypothetical protein